MNIRWLWGGEAAMERASVRVGVWRCAVAGESVSAPQAQGCPRPRSGRAHHDSGR